MASGPRLVRAPTGTKLSCKGWPQEAAMRMLMNNLDPEVAERPDDLIVYGGGGKAARNWECYDAIVATLQRLEGDETLLVQSGKPVGVFRTHPDAPRVLIANAHLVPRWASQSEFQRLDALGLTMYGQMTAGSWIYIGTQGILQGTYETFAAAADRHFGGTLAGTLTVTGGLGGMGGAQPLAVTMNGGVILGVDVDETRIQRRIEQGYCDVLSHDLDEALDRAHKAKAKREALSIGLVGNIAVVLPQLIERGIVPDLLTDQTSAHDLVNGYIPVGHTLDEADARRRDDAEGYENAVLDSMVTHIEGHAHPAQPGRHHLRLRQQPPRAGCRSSWFEAGLRHSWVCPRVHSSALLPRLRTVSLGRVVRRPGRHRCHRSGRPRHLPSQGAATALD